MFENKRIGVIVPAYNEELLISKVLSTMPDFVDTIIVVNDASTDNTSKIVENFNTTKQHIILINHDKNLGLGQSLIDGYNRALELEIDVIAIMAGDAQMSPDDLSRVIKPVVRNEFDYVKGNRLLREDVILRMPRHRYIGNSILTLLTKFATGYWSLIDPQCGYTAISKKALSQIPINQMIKGYGYNAHLLNMLNLNNMRVKDVEVEPVYGQEQSKIKLKSYIPTVSKLLVKLFFKRITHKYLMREFHPLIFFYLFSFFNGIVLGVPLMTRFIYMYSEIGYIPQTTLILLAFTLNMSFFGLFFGMWLDMEDNKKLTIPHN